MNLVHLRAFHAVASEGGVTRAARLLGLSQPTVSQQVRALEQAHGVILFERAGRQLRLTELGRALLAVTGRLFSAVAEAETLLTATRGLDGGLLRLGADAPQHALPLLAGFSAAHPGIAFSLIPGNSAFLLHELIETRIDLAIVSEAPGDGRCTAVLLRRDPLVALVAERDPAARRRAIGWAELVRRPLLLRESGSATRRMVEQALAERGLSAGLAIEVGTREAVLEAAAGGLGIGIVSSAELPPDPRVTALALEDAPLVDEYLVWLRARRALPIIGAFVDAARRVVASGALPPADPVRPRRP